MTTMPNKNYTGTGTSAIIDMYSSPDRTAHIETEGSNAKVRTIDFSKVARVSEHASGKVIDKGNDPRPRGPDGKLLTPKQIRSRARRRIARGMSNDKAAMSDLELEWLYKPLEEWDLEELAQGRPRASDGRGFKGPKPKWITQAVHEESMKRFQETIKLGMNVRTVDALETMQLILQDNSKDARGRPTVSPSTKLDAAKFLLEHVVGKPQQHITQDISVKLQGLLASVMVNPNEALAPGSYGGEGGTEDLPAYQVAHLPGHTIPLGNEDVWEGEIIDDMGDEDD